MGKISLKGSVGNSGSQPYPASGLAVVFPTPIAVTTS